MEKEKLVKIRITDAFGIGYVAGREYEVTPAEAVKLIEAGKAIPLTPLEGEGGVEKAIPKNPKIEKRG